MAGFLIGVCAAALIAAVTYLGYTQFDVPTGEPGENPSVKLEAPIDQAQGGGAELDE